MKFVSTKKKCKVSELYPVDKPVVLQFVSMYMFKQQRLKNGCFFNYEFNLY